MFLLKTETWYLERIVFMVAGVFSLIGLCLGTFWNPWGYALNALVGVNLLVFGTLGFCPMAIILDKVGIKSYCKRG